MWLRCSPFIIYILINSLSIPPNRLPSPSLQADSISLLPAREINERKQTITRELQLSFAVKLVLKTSLFCLLYSSQMGTKKRTKETSWSPLFTTVTPRFARAYAWKKIRVVTPALLERERERERERVQNYLELPNNLPSFSYLFLLKNQMYELLHLYLYYIGRCTV